MISSRIGVVYFIAIITISVYTIISICAPESLQSPQPQATNSTITFVPPPSTSAREKYLLEVSALFGVLGASIYGLASATVWIAHDKLERIQININSLTSCQYFELKYCDNC